MKKLIVVLLALALLAVPVVAFAWSGGVSAVPDCDGVTVTAHPPNFNEGLFQWRPVTIVGSGFFPWEDETSLSGTVTITWRKYGRLTGFPYNQYHTESFGWSATKPDCYETCDAVVDGTPGEWSEWILNQAGDGYYRTRTVPLVDSVDLATVCDTRTETETKDAVFEDGFSVVNNCFGVKISQHFYRDGEEYLPPVVVEQYDWQDAYNDHEVFYAQGVYPEGFPLVYDEDPVCPSCSYERQDYGLAELWGPSGQYATMYIYGDENGELPIGVGVERQKCVLGWVAVRSGAFDWVWKDTCTGEYFFNHKNVTPRPDVLMNGVCNRDGACLQ